jgi:hypothetical protein
MPGATPLPLQPPSMLNDQEGKEGADIMALSYENSFRVRAQNPHGALPASALPASAPFTPPHPTASQITPPDMALEQALYMQFDRSAFGLAQPLPQRLAAIEV